jgi:hypothetical protein
LVSQQNLISKISEFENEIRERSRVLKNKKEDYSDEAILNRQIEEALKDESTDKTKSGNDLVKNFGKQGDKQLDPLSRFNIDSDTLIVNKIGKKNDISVAIKAYDENELFKKYIRGEELSGIESTKIKTILSDSFSNDIKILAFCQRIRKTNKIKNTNHKKIIGLVELKNNIKKLFKIILGSTTEKQREIYSRDYIILMQFLTIIKVAIITNPNMEKLNKRIDAFKNDLTVGTTNQDKKNKVTNYFKQFDNGKISKLNNLEIIFDIFTASDKTETDSKIDKLHKYLKAIVKITDIEYNINAYLNDENKKNIDNIDNYIKEVWKPEELDVLSEYTPPDIKYEIRQKLWNKGGFTLDEWQTDLIDYIGSGESCLLTTPTGVGKTYTMMECISLIIDSINKRDKTKKMVYISPSIQLALQNYTNIMKTFSTIKVALITESFIYEPKLEQNERINIYVGTPIALSNHFSAKKITFNIGLFDEIHLILPTYARNKYEKLRIKETIKLLGMCTDQFIGASATIPSVKILSNYVLSKCVQLKKKKLNIIDFFDKKYKIKPTLPKLIEHVFDGNNFVNFKRDDNGNIEKYYGTTGETQSISLTGHEVSTENLYRLIMSGQFKDVLPALIFEKSEVHAFNTFQELVEKLKSENEKKYKNKIDLAIKIRDIAVEFNLDNVMANQTCEQQNVKLNQIFTEFKKCILKIGNKVIQQEQQNYVQIDDLQTYRDAICKILLHDVTHDKTKKDTERAFRAQSKEMVEKTTIAIQTAFEEEMNFPDVVKIYAIMTLTQITYELKEIIDAYLLYNADFNKNLENNKTSGKKESCADRLNYYLTCAGNEFKQLKKTKEVNVTEKTDTSGNIKPKKTYDNSLQTNLINNLYLIDGFGKQTIKDEFSKIDNTKDDVIGPIEKKSNTNVTDELETPNKEVIKNNTLIKLANLYIDAAEFGITCIIPNLPWFIQFDVINAIKESNSDNTMQVAYVFTSKDMAIGIDYPLNSVIIKAPNGTNIQTPVTGDPDFESILLVQMSGRCGRRKTQVEGRDGNIYYYGVPNYIDANTKRLIIKDDTEEKILKGVEDLNRQINKIRLSSVIIFHPVSDKNVSNEHISTPSLGLITTTPVSQPKPKESKEIEITESQIQQHNDTEIAESRDIILKLYKASLLQTNNIHEIELNELPIVKSIHLINDKFSAFNQPTLKLLKILDPSKAKNKYGLKLLLDKLRLYDTTINTNNIIELIFAFDSHEKNSETKIENAIIKYVKSETNNLARLEKLNKLNQMISQLIFLIFEIYNKNRNITLNLQEKTAITKQIRSIIRLFHMAETGLLQYLNYQALEKLFSSEKSKISEKEDTTSISMDEPVKILQPDLSTATLPKSKSGSNWIQEYMRDSNYKIIDTVAQGDCFFDTLRLGLEARGEVYTVAQIRDIAANLLTEQHFIEFNRRTQFGMNEYNFMDKINNLEQLKQYVKQPEIFWADDIIIKLLQEHFNVQMINFDNYRHSNTTDDHIFINCGPHDTQFNIMKKGNPQYIMTEYSGSHYKLVYYGDRRIFTFEQIPEDLKKKIVKKCFDPRDKQSYGIKTIPEIIAFKQQLDTKQPSSIQPNGIEQNISLLSLLI